MLDNLRCIYNTTFPAHKVIRFHTDGTHGFDVFNDIDTHIKSIELDIYDNRLYWIETNISTLINSMSLDGYHKKSFPVKDYKMGCEPILRVDKNYVYYVQMVDEQSHLFRVNKVDENIDHRFRITSGSAVFKDVAISSSEMLELPNHPCSKNNGNCKKYCFGVPDANKKLAKKCS